jgi:hypothetical protein
VDGLPARIVLDTEPLHDEIIQGFNEIPESRRLQPVHERIDSLFREKGEAGARNYKPVSILTCVQAPRVKPTLFIRSLV